MARLAAPPKIVLQNKTLGKRNTTLMVKEDAVIFDELPPLYNKHSSVISTIHC